MVLTFVGSAEESSEHESMRKAVRVAILREEVSFSNPVTGGDCDEEDGGESVLFKESRLI